MFTAWEDNYDKGEGAKKSKEASDAARSEQDEKIAAAKEKFNAAVELGNDLARKQFGQNAPDATRLISAASGGYGYKKGYVWNKANAVRVGQLLTKLKADADKLWTTIKDADGKVVLSSAWAVAFNTYLDRTKRIMKGPPYSFKGDYEPYEIFKYSRNESKPAKGTAYAASGANAKSREMMAAWEKFGKAQGWANNTGKYTLTGWPEGSTVSESMVKHTQKPIHEITLSDHFLMPDNGDMIKNVNPDCTHFGSEGEVSSVDALPDDVGHVISYEVTNDGPTYRQGDVLTKTLDQLETMSEGRNLNEHTTERGILKEWLQNRLDGILSD